MPRTGGILGVWPVTVLLSLLACAARVGELGGMVKRMFVALDLPGPVAGVLAGLDPRLAGLRWLPPSLLHLTLCFLGAVAEDLEPRLIAALAEIRVPPFPLALQGLGHFESHRQPAVVWVGVAPDASSLFHLQQQVRDAVLAAGLKPQRKPFHPHITVGRYQRGASAALQPFVERQGKTDFGTFEVTGFTLYSSILHPRGAEHVVVFRQDCA